MEKLVAQAEEELNQQFGRFLLDPALSHFHDTPIYPTHQPTFGCMIKERCCVVVWRSSQSKLHFH